MNPSSTESRRELDSTIVNIELTLASIPLLFFLNLGCAFSIWSWPDLFIAHSGHMCLISIQLASFIGYLIYIGRYFKALAPLLLRSREGAGEQ